MENTAKFLGSCLEKKFINNNLEEKRKLAKIHKTKGLVKAGSTVGATVGVGVEACGLGMSIIAGVTPIALALTAIGFAGVFLGGKMFNKSESIAKRFTK